jgi:hypothetical protein
MEHFLQPIYALNFCATQHCVLSSLYKFCFQAALSQALWQIPSSTVGPQQTLKNLFGTAAMLKYGLPVQTNKSAQVRVELITVSHTAQKLFTKLQGSSCTSSPILEPLPQRIIPPSQLYAS